MAHVSPHYSAAVFARPGHSSSTELRTHAGRIRRSAHGGRKSRRRDAHCLDRHLRPRSIARIRRSQSPGAASPGNFVCRALSGVCRQSPCVDACVDAMGSEVNPSALVASIHKERHGGTSFVLDVSVEAFPGITILFGPSGAGKSTLLDCVSGLVRPEAGKIAIGENILFDSTLRIDVPPQQRRIAYVFQSLALFPHLTVEQNIEYGLRDFSDQDRRERLQEILAAFRIEKLRNQKPAQMSGGEKQRTALARSLVTAPRALLLDEPLPG